MNNFERGFMDKLAELRVKEAGKAGDVLGALGIYAADIAPTLGNGVKEINKKMRNVAKKITKGTKSQLKNNAATKVISNRALAKGKVPDFTDAMWASS